MADPPALLPGLPDEISIWEILLRLPPKSLLRCRAVCRAWRGATSTRDFLLAHHARQPTLPILRGGFHNANGRSLDVTLFDHRAGVVAADRLQSVAQLGAGYAYFTLESSCDGLLALSIHGDSLCICNPATRQYAPLPLLSQFHLMGMYQHTPTGDYRLLLAPKAKPQDGAYIYTLGSSQPPRRIDMQCSHVDQVIWWAPGIVMFHGSLNWCTDNMIIVFDTTAESFRQMRAPVDPDGADLFEMYGTLSMSIFNDAKTSIDIWMTRDYESEIWALKYRVELPVAELTNQFGKFYKLWWLVVMSDEGDVLVLVKFGDSVLQIDVDGKLVASIHCGRLCPTRLWFKQTLVSHTFFPALEGYVVNASPFI
ncbi:unnamed protein product [Triticum turgidum subsp. durum]|uniref:F-box domain-containing protein n=1 Tax=Triticum turgidum subsp. durum TaxID=4567 RepID=A0A9R1QXR1_TRITD|nr:unnamed protein product [Triticum turgidum subsp. durum]